MIYTIRNPYLCVSISDEGAELRSVKSPDGTEYLWQADPVYWAEQAPNLFPYIGRMTGGRYSYDGRIYEMGVHGFLKNMTLQAERRGEDCMVFRLDSSAETEKQYPFAFTCRISYSLHRNKLITSYTVENHSSGIMFFGIGGHPGFRIPLEDGLTFEDYSLEFDRPALPYRIGFSETCFLSGVQEPYPLEEERRIPLRHNLFDHDAIVLKDAASSVKIMSRKGKRSVTVSYPQFAYIGFWHMPHTDAPYVCIEPWSSLPSRDGIVEELSLQPDLIRLGAGKTYENTWEIMIE